VRSLFLDPSRLSFALPAMLFLLLAPASAGARAQEAAKSEAPAAQQGPPDPGLVERVEVILVKMDLRAVDRSGRPVTDLRAEEIEVRHGKTRYKVAYLDPASPPPSTGDPSARIDLELPRGSLAFEPPDDEGRTVLILFDLLNSTIFTRERARRELREFLDGGAWPEDRIGLATVEADFRVRVMPTRDRELLAMALADDRTFGRPVDEPLPGLYRDIQIDRNVLPGTSGEAYSQLGQSRCETLSLVTLESYRTAVDMLAPLQGMKEIILISEGFPMSCPNPSLAKEGLFDLDRPYTDTEANDLRYRYPIRKGQVRYNVDATVHYSGMRGMFDRLLDAAARGRVAFLTIHPRPVGRFRLNESEVASVQSPALNALSRYTGGEHFAGGSVEKSLERSQNTSGGSYELGYYLPAEEANRPSREVELKSLRKKVKLRYRRGRSAEIPEVLREDGALHLIRGDAWAEEPSASPDGGPAVVTVEVDPTRFRYVPLDKKSGRIRGRFSVGLTLRDLAGRTATEILFLITDDRMASDQPIPPLRYRATIHAAPGEYRLRAFLSEPDGGALAETEIPVDILEKKAEEASRPEKAAPAE
jgi:VWFA-related protein